VVVVMVVVMVVMVAVMVMSIARRRVPVGLLAVVKVALVPRRRRLLRRRVERPLRWSLRRRVRLRVPWWRIGLRDLLVAHGAVVASPCPPIDELGASVVGG